MEEKKLFLLDAYALIYRAYYALIRSPRITSDGRNTSAIFGFCNTLDDILRKENPPYMAVCFDPPHGETFRHEEYPEYKAQRDKQPEDITFAIPYIKQIIEAWGIKVVEVPRYEADDVIGTLSVEADRLGFTTYMMTPDKDYGQLVTDRVLMYRPALKGKDFEIRGPQQVCERYGISSPRQVIDLLALEGDVSDNIPGCPGVGEKTAAKLISEWGSVENLIDHVSDLKGALKTKIESNAEQILFSKHLVTIKTDVPLDVTPEDLVRREPDVERLTEIFKKLEFKTFLNRFVKNVQPEPEKPQPVTGSLFDILEEESQPGESETGTRSSVETVICKDAEEVSRLIKEALCEDMVAVSLYADGEEAMTADWKGLAVSASENINFYIPVDRFDRVVLAELLTPLFNTPGVTVASHDVKRDIIILRRHDIEWTAGYADTAISHYILKPESKHELPEVALNTIKLVLADASLSSTERRKPLPGPVESVGVRVAERADAVRRLVGPLSAAIAELGHQSLLDDIELPLVRVLAEMEWTGVRIDTRELAEMSVKLTRRLDELQEKCWEMAGTRFNIGSPAQVGEVLFERLQIDPKAKKTKKGAWSTTEEILEGYRHKWPIVDLILEIRGLKKLLATYIDALPKLINPRTGKIHTTFNQTVTATGRISSTNPNLQNIPIRTDEGREIRRAFVADPGDLIMSADYSQIELRLMADMSGDETMIEAFQSGQDIHRATAAKIYHIEPGDVTDNQRRAAKTANFGIIYGISAFGLSQRLAIPRAEAKDLINGYLRTYPGVDRYMTDAIERAKTDGFVETVKGRRRYLPDLTSRNAVVRGYAERNAINAPIQGSAADIIKIAMIDIAREIARRALRSRMILQVHDELVFNVVPEELDELRSLVIEKMEHAYRSRVPLDVSAGVGHNWLEAH
ncbi:MAG: DNA polymerase I [Muribaculaceae bacterium]|nr:DNA polymerase I [Muribaculaceae bacterium]